MATLKEVVPELWGKEIFNTSKAGSFMTVRGVFPMAKNAFLATSFEHREGFTVSLDTLEELGIKPDELLIAQCRRFSELAAEALSKPKKKQGEFNSMERHVKVGLQSLVDAGLPLEDAKVLVSVSLQDLHGQGVREPSCIPCNYACYRRETSPLTWLRSLLSGVVKRFISE